MTQHVTEYCGAFVYQDNTLQMVLTPEGRLLKTSEEFDCQYYLKDHLGNVNVVFREDRTTHLAVIVQEDQFYPFGMKLGNLSSTSDIANKFLYQGKELLDNAIDQNSDGITDRYLNWYDFGARQFDPQLCRWHVPDPANQHPSPYLAMSNNPVSFIDPDGLRDTGNWINDYTVWYTSPLGYIIKQFRHE
jgi:RHS repeat-associated protein